LPSAFSLGIGSPVIAASSTNEWPLTTWPSTGIRLTVSGCAGPCDISNVVAVNSEAGSQWLGNITRFDQYRSLIEWAARSVNAGHLLELSREFKDHLVEPWR